MNVRLVVALCLVAVGVSVLADSIDDAEAKRRGVPVAQVVAENALAKEKAKNVALEKRVAELERQLAEATRQPPPSATRTAATLTSTPTPGAGGLTTASKPAVSTAQFTPTFPTSGRVGKIYDSVEDTTTVGLEFHAYPQLEKPSDLTTLDFMVLGQFKGKTPDVVRISAMITHSLDSQKENEVVFLVDGERIKVATFGRQDGEGKHSVAFIFPRDLLVKLAEAKSQTIEARADSIQFRFVPIGAEEFLAAISQEQK